MANEVQVRTPMQWAALVGAAALFWGILIFVGTQFRDYMRVDMEQLVLKHITDHERTATAARTDFFRAIESRADSAVTRTSQLERNCDVVQSRLTGIDGAIAELNRWRGECGQKMATVQSYIARDATDIAKIESRIERVEELVSKGRRE